MVSKTMRAVDIKGGAGPPSALFINDAIPRPDVKPNECLIRVKAFGLNRADTIQRVGNYPVPAQASKILGLEFSGLIDEVGSGATEDQHHWKVGDEVFGLTYGGAYAEYLTVSKRMLLRKPSELSWEECAGVPEVWFTALQALQVVGGYNPHTTRSVLWHAAASSVSIAGIQLSLAANEHTEDDTHKHHDPPAVFATARQDEKCDLARQLGAKGAVNTRTHPSDWAAEIKKQNNGDGVDLLIDFIGASVLQQNLEVLNRDGRIVQLGMMGGSKLEGVDVGMLLYKRIRWEGSTLRSRDEAYQGKLRDMFEEKVMDDMKKGKFDVKIDTTASWSRIADMHEKLEKNETKGKIVCVVD